MTPQVKQEINNLIQRFGYCMFEFRNGQVYLLRDHWKYIHPEDAPRLRIGSAKPPKEAYTRQSHKMYGSILMYRTEQL